MICISLPAEIRVPDGKTIRLLTGPRCPGSVLTTWDDVPFVMSHTISLYESELLAGAETKYPFANTVKSRIKPLCFLSKVLLKTTETALFTIVILQTFISKRESAITMISLFEM